MPLNLDRRHYRKAGKCVGGHSPDAHTYEPEELRRSHKRCICPIYVDGTLNHRSRSTNTGKNAWEQSGSWDQQDLPQPQPVPAASPAVATDTDGVGIEQALAAVLAEHVAASSPNTVKKYRMILKKLSS